MRYALRNQKKISEKIGINDLEVIIASLEAHFKNNENIELDESDNPKYSGLIINREPHSEGIILFYVLRITFDVYHLAFKEFIN